MTCLQETVVGLFVKKIMPTLKLQCVCVCVGGGEVCSSLLRQLEVRLWTHDLNFY